jgi:hypothetical protein
MEINGIKIMSAAELMAIAGECNDGDYRRGYIHGYLAAIDDRGAGASLQGMIDFFNKELTDWREGDLKSLIIPPERKI